MLVGIDGFQNPVCARWNQAMVAMMMAAAIQPKSSMARSRIIAKIHRKAWANDDVQA
jgi:hypothetical protein